MSFVERYVPSLTSSDLRDDEHHVATEPLHASASADVAGGALLGSLLCRVKYADGSQRKTFESGSHNLAHLLRAWTEMVAERGAARKWVPANTAWDMAAALTLYERVAHGSLAHWLDGLCELCRGAKVNQDRRTCTCCGGTGRAQVAAGRFETQLILDMVSELEGIFQAHSSRAATKLRRVV